MNIFISYSTDDLKIVRQIAGYLKPHVDKVKYWDKSMKPGEKIWGTIFKWIDTADLVLVIITDNSVSRSPAVDQEIGYAKAEGKNILPLVTGRVDTAKLGCLHDVIYFVIDPDNLQPAFNVIASKIEEIRKKKFVSQGVLWAILGLVGGMILFGSDDDDY